MTKNSLPGAHSIPVSVDIESYRSNGYYFSDVVIPDHVLDAAEEGMKRFYAGERDRQVSDREDDVWFGWTPSDGDRLRKNDYASLQINELAALVMFPAIGAIAARLCGTTSVRLWHDQLLYKPSANGDMSNVGWHTDRQYWQTCKSEEMLTAWIPFHDVDEECGSVTFLKGSNHWNQRALDFFDNDLQVLQRRFDNNERPLEFVSAALPRGAVSFHHARTVHGSGPNTSGRPRRSLAVHIQPATNRYRNAFDDSGEVARHKNDDLCSWLGVVPNYSDPGMFPVLNTEFDSVTTAVV